MNLTTRAGGPLCGRVHVPGDKSISHRALFLGVIADGVSRVTNFLPAADCLASLECVRACGIEVERAAGGDLLVRGRGLHGLREPADVLNCRGSATTMRLLAGMLAGQAFCSVLSGNEALRRRPMGRVVEPLREMGATILARGGGQLPPLAVSGGHLRGMEYTLPIASAQVKSALLLAGLYARGAVTLVEPGPARDHTERMLRARGARLEVGERTITLHPGNRLAAVDTAVPGDFSSAAFILAAGCLVPRSEIVIQAVNVNPTRTGFLDALRLMGADIVVENQVESDGEPVADIIVRSGVDEFPHLRGIELGGDWIPRMIDELPILAVVATRAAGQTVVRDAAELRVKETDRVAALTAELHRLGACIQERPDGFVVQGPTRLQGTRVSSHSDHRLAMSLAVAGLVASGQTCVENAECMADSFPRFATTLGQLARRGKAREVEP